MINNRLIVASIIALILTFFLLFYFAASNWTQHQKQYKELVDSFQQYEKFVEQESAVADVWHSRLENGSRSYAWVENRSRSLTFRMFALREQVDVIDISPGFRELNLAKNKLLVAIDANIRWLNFLNFLNRETNPGNLTLEESRDQLLAVAQYSSAEDSVLKILLNNKPSPDTGGSAVQLRKIEKFFRRYP